MSNSLIHCFATWVSGVFETHKTQHWHWFVLGLIHGHPTVWFHRHWAVLCLGRSCAWGWGTARCCVSSRAERAGEGAAVWHIGSFLVPLKRGKKRFWLFWRAGGARGCQMWSKSKVRYNCALYEDAQSYSHASFSPGSNVWWDGACWETTRAMRASPSSRLE